MKTGICLNQAPHVFSSSIEFMLCPVGFSYGVGQMARFVYKHSFADSLLSILPVPHIAHSNQALGPL